MYLRIALNKLTEIHVRNSVHNIQLPVLVMPLHLIFFKIQQSEMNFFL